MGQCLTNTQTLVDHDEYYVNGAPAAHLQQFSNTDFRISFIAIKAVNE